MKSGDSQRKIKLGFGTMAPGVANSSYSFIGGGKCNTIDCSYSSIAGGFKNTVSGQYSSILGGNNNNDGGLNNVFIAGSGINAGAVGIPNALHVNGLWANGLFLYPGGPLPTPGTVMMVNPAGPFPPLPAMQLWIA
jgi:hypothetical protein